MRGHLLIAYALLGLALFLASGPPGPVALPLVISCVAILWNAIRRGAHVPEWPRIEGGSLAAILLLAECALLWAKPLGIYLVDGAMAARLCLFAAGLLAAGGMLWRRVEFGHLGAFAILVLAAAAGGLVIAASPHPVIDVFVLQQEGARDFWSGLDPYRSTFANPYARERALTFFGAQFGRLTHYPYPPLSLIWTALAWRVAGDVRHGLLIAQLATGLGLYVLARRHAKGNGVPAGLMSLFLLHPRGMFVLEQSWTEPIVCCAFVWTVCAFDRRENGAFDWLGAIALGLFLAAKQYGVLLLPLFASRRFFRGARPAVIGGGVLALALTAPFAFWDWQSFVDDVVLFHVRQPFRSDSLSVAPMIAFLSGWKTGALSPVAALAAGWWSWKRVPRDTFGFCLCAGLVMLAFFVTAKQAFCNYYYFAGTIVLCSAICSRRPAERS